MPRYYESISIKYHNNVIGNVYNSSHPTTFRLDDGSIVHITEEDRESAIVTYCYSDYGKKFMPVKKGIEFKILNTWEDNACTSGTWIRWKLPKGTQVLE